MYVYTYIKKVIKMMDIGPLPNILAASRITCENM